DVMDLRRKDEFRQSLEDFRYAHADEAGVHTKMVLGTELYVDDVFFTDFAARQPEVAEVSVQPRDKTFQNELQFRFDVTIAKQAESAPPQHYGPRQPHRHSCT